MTLIQICKYCKNFITGSGKKETTANKLSDLRNSKAGRCTRHHYKTTENSFCKLPKEFKKK